MLAGLLGSLSAAHAQEPLLTEVRTVASAAPPVLQTFEIPQGGEYELTLTDFEFPARLAAVKLAVTRGDTVVTQLEGAAAAHRFTATAGTHTVHVVGIPDAASVSGSFGVEIKRVADNASTLQFADSLGLPPAEVDGRGVIAETFTVPATGSYEVSLTDLQLPQSLTTLTLAITRPGSVDLFTIGTPGTQTFTLQAGEYRLFVIAQAPASVKAGLFSVNIQPAGGGESLYARTETAGDVRLLGEPPLTAGLHSVTLTDFGFPASLVNRQVVVARNGAVAARLSAPGDASFTAVAGAHSIYAFAAPAPAPGSGSYGVEVRPSGAAPAFTAVQTVGGAPGTTPAYAFTVDVAAAGAYRVRLADFEFPGAFGTLGLAATQGGALMGSLSSAGSLNLDLPVGRTFLLVIARPAADAGLFGIDVTAAAGGDPLFEITQGVGKLFSARKVSISTAGRYDVTLKDLAFPKAFADLAAVVTRGSDRQGSIFGGGTFGFDATPGNYFINFIARGDLLDATQTASDQRAGTYFMAVAPAAPAPTLTLNSNRTEVSSGEAIDLTWTAQNAASCTASGGWSGSRAAQGTERIASVTTATTFTLTCTGAGGTAAQSVSINVVAARSSGGGGSLDWLTLALLLAAIAGAVRQLRH